MRFLAVYACPYAVLCRHFLTFIMLACLLFQACILIFYACLFGCFTNVHLIFFTLPILTSHNPQLLPSDSFQFSEEGAVHHGYLVYYQMFTFLPLLRYHWSRGLLNAVLQRATSRTNSCHDIQQQKTHLLTTFNFNCKKIQYSSNNDIFIKCSQVYV